MVTEVGTRALEQFSTFPTQPVNLTFQDCKGQTAFSEGWAALPCVGGASWVHIFKGGAYTDLKDTVCVRACTSAHLVSTWPPVVVFVV